MNERVMADHVIAAAVSQRLNHLAPKRYKKCGVIYQPNICLARVESDSIYSLKVGLSTVQPKTG